MLETNLAYTSNPFITLLFRTNYCEIIHYCHVLLFPLLCFVFLPHHFSPFYRISSFLLFPSHLTYVLLFSPFLFSSLSKPNYIAGYMAALPEVSGYSVCMYICLSVCLSDCLFVCLSVCLPV